MKTVAIVIPIYKDSLTADEQISFRQLRHFLSGYDSYFAAPQGLKLPDGNIPARFFDKKYFTGLASYSQLMTSLEFYRAFEDYEYLLVYQPDALVFSDQLLQWCEKGYDYIGAPWLKEVLPPNDPRGDCVGNGGFSLRKVSGCIKTIENYRHWRAVVLGLAKTLRALLTPWSFRSWRQWLNTVRWNFFLVPVFGHVLVDDYFWAFEAKRHNPAFRVAPVAEALQFSFENNPRRCFEKNNRRLPFGCHAWAKYDRGFWQEYLLTT